jgi:hypothetical protein
LVARLGETVVSVNGQRAGKARKPLERACPRRSTNETKGTAESAQRSLVFPPAAAGTAAPFKEICCAPDISSYVASMDWQQVISLVIVVTVTGLFVWSRFRPRKFSFERDTHCGCSSVQSSAPKSSIVFRARKGERPQILVKS